MSLNAVFLKDLILYTGQRTEYLEDWSRSPNRFQGALNSNCCPYWWEQIWCFWALYQYCSFENSFLYIHDLYIYQTVDVLWIYYVLCWGYPLFMSGKCPFCLCSVYVRYSEMLQSSERGLGGSVQRNIVYMCIYIIIHPLKTLLHVRLILNSVNLYSIWV